VWDFRNAGNFPRTYFTHKPRIHICPVGISKKIWIQIYFGLMTVNSVEIFRHLAFCCDGLRVATLFIALKNCVF